MLSTLKIKKGQSLEDFINKFTDFENSTEACTTCKTTNERLRFKLQSFKKHKTLEDAPQFLIFQLDLVGKDGKIKEREASKPLLKFNVAKLFSEHSDADQMYNLVAMVDLQGTCLEDSVYTAYAKRKSSKDESKNKWYAFTQKQHWTVEKKEFNEKTKPQILIYQLQ